MASDRQLSRIARRPDQILEVQWGPIPEPPPEMERLPGIRSWFQQLKLSRERDISSIERMLNNLNQQAATASGSASTPGPAGPAGADGATGPPGPSVITAHAVTHRNGGSDVLLLHQFGDPTGSVQFSQQQALQFRVENRTSDPATPAVGELWLRTDL